MRKAALIYNPTSGRLHHLRVAKVEAAARLLWQAGVESLVIATHGPGSAGQQAIDAIAEGCDTVFACGGDGTMNDVLQGMVAAGRMSPRRIPLGILPLGTGNVLAYDLGLPRDCLSAVKAQLDFVPRTISVGRAEYQKPNGERASRYFTIVAGVGADAEMIYRVKAESKKRLGLFAYALEMARMGISHKFVPFEVEYAESSTGRRRTATVYQIAAVRVTNFGAMLRRFAPGASLDREDFELVLFKSPARWEHLKYSLNSFAGCKLSTPTIERVYAAEIQCRPLSVPETAQVSVEVDGEFLGRMPVKISIEHDAVTLLMPKARAVTPLGVRASAEVPSMI
jgi:YegS/Rv2252/BmrU family lipid kinase